MGSIVFPAARALVSWLEEHGGDLKGVRALGRINLCKIDLTIEERFH